MLKVMENYIYEEDPLFNDTLSTPSLNDSFSLLPSNTTDTLGALTECTLSSTDNTDTNNLDNFLSSFTTVCTTDVNCCKFPHYDEEQINCLAKTTGKLKAPELIVTRTGVEGWTGLNSTFLCPKIRSDAENKFFETKELWLKVCIHLQLLQPKPALTFEADFKP